MLGLALAPTVVFAQPSQPKLVLQITVDALRGDLPERFRHNYGEGGFERFLDQGIHYTNAHFEHSNTETIVGHVALATGAPPAVNGMVGNLWYDRSLKRVVYNIEDGDYNLLSQSGGVDKSTEIDTTQKAAQGDGRSPLNIHTSTFSDELVKAYNGQSKAYSVSFKDRGAVSLAGELGKAFWYSKAANRFVTSDYYYDENPQWLDDWNDKAFYQNYDQQQWQLAKERSEYLFADDKNANYKTVLGSFGNGFPHAYGSSEDKYFSTFLSMSPAGDELVADLAKSLIETENLGQGNHPDYLSLSFSATDYVIHMFGPSSIEAEDNLIRLDHTLADLFDYVDKTVGLENTLIVLSADHGAPDVPGYVHHIGGFKGGFFGLRTLKQAGIFESLEKQYQLPKEVVLQYADPYLYLDQELIQSKGLELAEIQGHIAEHLVKINGVDQAITAHNIETGQLANTRINRLVANNHHSTRSGDIYLVYDPSVYINDFDGLQVASVHGSPWRYDTFVPVIFAGMDLKPQQIAREITPYDIAPTLSQYLGITFPSGATGKVLEEVINP
jgi:predicted AlkP superfamily pyrophosphatase or phosphodiesterase